VLGLGLWYDMCFCKVGILLRKIMSTIETKNIFSTHYKLTFLDIADKFVFNMLHAQVVIQCKIFKFNEMCALG